MEAMKILNCAVGNSIAFLFIALLSKMRFKNPLTLAAVIIAGAAVEYLFSDAGLLFQDLISLAVMISGSLTVFKSRPEEMIAYSLIAVYISNISDLIFGSFAAMVLGKQFSDAMLPQSAERLIIKVFAAALLAMVFLILRKKDGNIPRKFLRLFDAVLFVFLSVIAVFLAAYHNSAISTDKGNMLAVSAIALTFLAASFAMIYFFSEICAGFQREQKLLLLEANYNYFQEQVVLQNENAQTLKKFVTIS